MRNHIKFILKNRDVFYCNDPDRCLEILKQDPFSIHIIDQNLLKDEDFCCLLVSQIPSMIYYCKNFSESVKRAFFENLKSDNAHFLLLSHFTLSEEDILKVICITKTSIYIEHFKNEIVNWDEVIKISPCAVAGAKTLSDDVYKKCIQVLRNDNTDFELAIKFVHLTPLLKLTSHERQKLTFSYKLRDNRQALNIEQSEEGYWDALKKDPNTIQCLIDPTEEMCEYAISMKNILYHIPCDLRTEKLCLMALKLYGYDTIQDWPRKYLTKEFCESIVLDYYHALRYIDNPSHDLLERVVSKYPKAIKYITKPHDDIVMLAISKDIEVIKYLTEITEEQALFAIEVDWRAIVFIRPQTLRICQKAISINPHSVFFIDSYYLKDCIVDFEVSDELLDELIVLTKY